VFAVALLGAILANPAHACSSAGLTLQQLIGGETFRTNNGLRFGDFRVEISGDLEGQIEPGDIRVTILGDGFHLSGPMSAANGEMGDILLFYSVSAEFEAIIGASLFSNGVAVGSGAQVAVDKQLLIADDEEVGRLSAWDTGAVPGDAIFFDEIVFGEPLQEILVVKDILLDSSLLGGGFGGSARISLIEQSFSVVPEPGTLALTGIGLAGLARLGRRRAG
jgi:hypothetical protein